MTEAAIIFDVDGVLLELTRHEEELFFLPFESRMDASQLSREWNSYKIRNDEDIIAEIITKYKLLQNSCATIKAEYLTLLAKQLQNQTITSRVVTGANELLQTCSAFAILGIATANFRQAAKLRLEQAGLWSYVHANAHGADGGGHKHQILGRALAKVELPKSRIVYVGDNLNDLEAGVKNQVHFIGFSEDQSRLLTLKNAGAKYLSSNHLETLAMIKTILKL